MEQKKENTGYFTRDIKEGTVKRKHICSFDPAIELTTIVTSGKKVLDYLERVQANAMSKGDEDSGIDKKALQESKDYMIRATASLRINGKPIAYEDLGSCFDSQEILEVVSFIQGSDMKQFGGTEKAEKKD